MTKQQRFDQDRVRYGAMTRAEYDKKWKKGKHGPKKNSLEGPGGLYKNLVKKIGDSSARQPPITAREILETVTAHHPNRAAALAHLRNLRSGGFKGRAAVEPDKRLGTYFIRRKEGELAEPKPRRTLTPYDKQIRQMLRFGTEDLHGALTDVIYGDKRARRDYEGDNPEGSWEDAAADLAANYLEIHGLGRRSRFK
jgi:hypothetical protein